MALFRVAAAGGCTAVCQVYVTYHFPIISLAWLYGSLACERASEVTVISPARVWGWAGPGIRRGSGAWRTRTDAETNANTAQRYPQTQP